MNVKLKKWIVPVVIAAVVGTTAGVAVATESSSPPPGAGVATMKFGCKLTSAEAQNVETAQTSGHPMTPQQIDALCNQ